MPAWWTKKSKMAVASLNPMNAFGFSRNNSGFINGKSSSAPPPPRAARIARISGCVNAKVNESARLEALAAKGSASNVGSWQKVAL
jgi:hypothetical protein